MSRHRPPLSTVTLIVLAVLACRGESAGSELRYPSSRDGENPPTRSTTSTRWDTIASVGGSIQDSVIFDPYWIAADGTGFYVFDGSDQRLVAYTSDGNPRWSVGRRGHGPQEFANVRDIRVAPDGNIHVLDLGNSRNVIVRPDGTFAGLASFRLDRAPHQVVPLSGERFALTTVGPRSSRRPITVYDNDGVALSKIAIPWERHSELPGLAAILIAARDPDTRQWVAGYHFGSGWFVFSDTSSIEGPRSYVDPTPFPRPVVKEHEGHRSYRMPPDAVPAARDLDIAGNTLYVLSGTVEKGPFRVLDAYDVETGRYLDSYRLPFRVSRFATHGRRLYLIRRYPAPAVYVFKLEPL